MKKLFERQSQAPLVTTIEAKHSSKPKSYEKALAIQAERITGKLIERAGVHMGKNSWDGASPDGTKLVTDGTSFVAIEDGDKFTEAGQYQGRTSVTNRTQEWGGSDYKDGLANRRTQVRITKGNIDKAYRSHTALKGNITVGSTGKLNTVGTSAHLSRTLGKIRGGIAKREIAAGANTKFDYDEFMARRKK